MIYFSQNRGIKPGGSNLTYGYTKTEDAATSSLPVFLQRQSVDPLVFQTFETETLDATEIGLKADFFDGRARANIAIFDYSYENLQVQGTDPDVFRGGVVNLPESEVFGLEIEFTGALSDSLTIDMNLAFFHTEISKSYLYLDNVKAQQHGTGSEIARDALKEDVLGNDLAKAPKFSGDISLIYSTELASGDTSSTALQYIKLISPENLGALARSFPKTSSLRASLAISLPVPCC
jgi:iron complex outermembrane receptor protein